MICGELTELMVECSGNFDFLLVAIDRRMISDFSGAKERPRDSVLYILYSSVAERTAVTFPVSMLAKDSFIST
jgi:hypothetical protein